MRYKLHLYEASLEAYLKVLAIDEEDIEAHKRRRDIFRSNHCCDSSGSTGQGGDPGRGWKNCSHG